MAQTVTGAEAADVGFVSFANGIRVLVLAAAGRTASLVVEGLRAGLDLATSVFEAAGGLFEGAPDVVVDLTQSAAGSFGGPLHEICETVAFVVRFAAALQCCYLVYRFGVWERMREVGEGRPARELDEGEVATVEARQRAVPDEADEAVRAPMEMPLAARGGGGGDCEAAIGRCLRAAPWAKDAQWRRRRALRCATRVRVRGAASAGSRTTARSSRRPGRPRRSRRRSAASSCRAPAAGVSGAASSATRARRPGSAFRRRARELPLEAAADGAGGS